jgi:hypothetical protein
MNFFIEHSIADLAETNILYRYELLPFKWPEFNIEHPEGKQG